jgi:hypothetical protein
MEIIGNDVEEYGCGLSYHSHICLNKLRKTMGTSVRIDGAGAMLDNIRTVHFPNISHTCYSLNQLGLCLESNQELPNEHEPCALYVLLY